MKIQEETNITRKEALNKLGKYAALTALGTYMILNPQKTQAASPPTDPGSGFSRGSRRRSNRRSSRRQNRQNR